MLHRSISWFLQARSGRWRWPCRSLFGLEASYSQRQCDRGINDTGGWQPYKAVELPDGASAVRSAVLLFMPYVREDSAKVNWLQRELEAAGITVWCDGLVKTALRILVRAARHASRSASTCGEFARPGGLMSCASRTGYRVPPAFPGMANTRATMPGRCVYPGQGSAVPGSVKPPACLDHRPARRSPRRPRAGPAPAPTGDGGDVRAWPTAPRPHCGTTRGWAVQGSRQMPREIEHVLARRGSELPHTVSCTPYQRTKSSILPPAACRPA